MFDILTKWKAARASKRLEKTLRPDPDYRARRLAQFDTDRRERIAMNLRAAGLREVRR